MDMDYAELEALYKTQEQGVRTHIRSLEHIMLQLKVWPGKIGPDSKKIIQTADELSSLISDLKCILCEPF